MAKYVGIIGYTTFIENPPGVWTEIIRERKYTGDIIRNTRRWETTQNANDNLTINNQISIVADPYALQNFFAMRYLTWMGSKWKITNVEVQRPRLLLTIGGVYNGPEA